MQAAFRYVLFVILAAPSAAESFAASTWNNPAGGAFSSAGNWIGGVPGTGAAVTYNLNGTYAVNVDVAANHGATQFSASNADVTLNITGSSYTIPDTVKIGALGGTNRVSVTGASFKPTHLQIAPLSGQAGQFNLSGPMQASSIAVGGIITSSGPLVYISSGGWGALTLNPGADLTVNQLLASHNNGGSPVDFNGGTLTVTSRGYFSNAPTFTQIGDGTNAATLNLGNGTGGGRFEFANQTLTIANNATLNFNSPGGQLTAKSIVRDTSGSGPGTFHWLAGYLTFDEDYEISSSTLLGASVVLAPEQGLVSYGELSVPSGTSLTLSGGNIDARTIVVSSGANVIYNSGKLSVNSGGLEIGPNGLQNSNVVVTDPVNDSIYVWGGQLSIASGRSLSINGGLIRFQSLMNNGLFAFNSGVVQSETSLSIGSTGHINNSPTISLNSGSAISLIRGGITIQSGQTITLDGGILGAEYLVNNGTLNYVSGDVRVSEGDLTFGPTGQFRNQMNFDFHGGVNVPNGTVTFEQGVTATFNGASLTAEDLVIGGDVKFVSMGGVSPNSLTIASADGNAKLTVGQSVSPFLSNNVFAQSIYRGNLVVNNSKVSATTISPPPNYAHNSSATINGGEVYGWTMNVGAEAGYVDTLTVNGGSLYSTTFLANKGAASQVVFNGGTILMSHAEVDGTSAFVIGDGTRAAKLILWGSKSSTQNFADGLVVSTSGELVGEGIITADVTNYGLLSPGQSAGTLTINGSFINRNTLELDIYGDTLVDRLTINGTFEAGGVIRLSVLNRPAIGDVFDLVDATSFIDSGYKLEITASRLPKGLGWDVSRFEIDGTVRVISSISGDFNGDGFVNAADYVVWRMNNGSQPEFEVWRENFGRAFGQGSGAISEVAVPEPASAMLLVAAIAGWSICRRRSH